MFKTPLIERIERWVDLAQPKVIVVHEDDIEQIVKQKIYQAFSQPFKVLGANEMFGGKADGSL